MINITILSVCSMILLLLVLANKGAFSKEGLTSNYNKHSTNESKDSSKNRNLIKRVPIGKGGLSFDVYFVDLEQSELEFYHKNTNGKKIKNIDNLKSQLKKESKKLLFATNGGIFNSNYEPLGLYIEKGKTVYPLNLKKGTEKFTNFYDLPPNGVFYIQNDNSYGIVPREKFQSIKNVKYATQSAPLAISNGEINLGFNKNSKSKFIRSGVGITTPNGIMNTYEMIFVISNGPVNFFDFSRIFKYYGCDQALYLDGLISEMYHHTSKKLGRTTTTNDFALMIAVTEKQ